MGAKVTAREYADLKKRALRGARRLDCVNPGWALKVSLSRLNLARGNRCVLGQLYGSFQNGVSEVLWAGAIDPARDEGFVAPLGSMGYTDNRLYPALTHIWKSIIRAWRQAGRQMQRAKARV